VQARGAAGRARTGTSWTPGRVAARGQKTPGQNGFVLSEPRGSWTLLLGKGSEAAPGLQI